MKRRRRLNRKHYVRRNEILKGLGYSSYRQYLASDVWRKIRSDVLSATKSCWCCRSKPATQVHHTEYTLENLSGATTSGLVGMCGGCHYGSEFSAKYGKVDLPYANKRASKIRKRNIRRICFRINQEYRDIADRYYSIKRTMLKCPERSAMMVEMRRKRRAIEKTVAAGLSEGTIQVSYSGKRSKRRGKGNRGQQRNRDSNAGPRMSAEQAAAFSSEVIGFGKYSGSKICDIPVDYLRFIAQPDPFKQRLVRYLATLDSPVRKKPALPSSVPVPHEPPDSRNTDDGFDWDATGDEIPF